MCVGLKHCLLLAQHKPQLLWGFQILPSWRCRNLGPVSPYYTTILRSALSAFLPSSREGLAFSNNGRTFLRIILFLWLNCVLKSPRYILGLLWSLWTQGQGGFSSRNPTLSSLLHFLSPSLLLPEKRQTPSFLGGKPPHCFLGVAEKTMMASSWILLTWRFVTELLCSESSRICSWYLNWGWETTFPCPVCGKYLTSRVVHLKKSASAKMDGGSTHTCIHADTHIILDRFSITFPHLLKLCQLVMCMWLKWLLYLHCFLPIWFERLTTEGAIKVMTTDILSTILWYCKLREKDIQLHFWVSQNLSLPCHLIRVSTPPGNEGTEVNSFPWLEKWAVGMKFVHRGFNRCLQGPQPGMRNPPCEMPQLHPYPCPPHLFPMRHFCSFQLITLFLTRASLFHVFIPSA